MATIRALSRVIHRGMSRTVRSSTAADDTALWVAAVIANGGTVSAGRQATVSAFVAAEKTAGTWGLTDDYWGLWGENAVQGLTSLKQRRLATVTAAPAFTIDRGYLFNGTTNYIDTGFSPSGNGIALTGTDQRLGVYLRNDIATGVYSAGSSNASAAAGSIAMQGRNAAVTFATLNSAGVSITLTVATALGFTAVSRASGGTTVNGYKNGVALTPATAVTPVTTLPAFTIHIGARNLTGAANSFRADSTGFVCVGAPLSAAQETAQYNNVQTWATAIGAQV